MMPDIQIWTNNFTGDREIHFYPPGERDKYIIGFGLEFFSVKDIVTILRIKGWEISEENINDILNQG